MLTKHLIKATQLSLLLLIVTIAGCVNNKTITSAPSSAKPIKLSPTATPTKLPPITTATYLPTLSSAESQRKITELMLPVDKCILPCWWGIKPGETSLSIAQHQLSELTNQSKPYPLSQQINEYSYEFYDSLTEKVTFISFYEKNDIVISIQVLDSELTGIYYSISQILASFGRPQNIFILSVSEPFGDSVLPFMLILDYSRDGFRFIFDGQGVLANNTIRWCNTEKSSVFPHIGNIAPTLFLWNPIDIYPASIDSHTRFPNISNFKNLEEVTDSSLEEFYNHFAAGNESICLYTPTSTWGKITDWSK